MTRSTRARSAKPVTPTTTTPEVLPVDITTSDPPSSEPIALHTVAEAPASVDATLVHILSSKRKHGSTGEAEFLTWLHAETKARGYKATVKAQGCIAVEVRAPGGKMPTTLFSSHVDTVDGSKMPGPQGIVYDPTFGHIFLDKDHAAAGTCLGADDGAGVWIMLEMISAKVPGMYVFHRGEECGGIGSRALLDSSRPWLEGFDAAVAFDRADDYEVITHQGGLRCASDKFGTALCTQLNLAQDGFKYKLSQGGTFTDTKVYRGVIAECVNVGVGYHGQHGPSETLDYAHLVKLRDACIKVAWEALPVDRDPRAIEPPRYQGGFGDFGAGGRYEAQQDMWDRTYASNKKKWAAPKAVPAPELEPHEEIRGMSLDEITAWVEDDPASGASLLVSLGAEVVGLRAQIDFLKGALK